MGRKYCTGCNQEKDYSEFHKDRKYLRSNCKECHNAEKRNNYLNKRDYYTKKMSLYDSTAKAKQKRSERRKERKKNDPIFKMQSVYRSRLQKALSGWCRSKASMDLLGCSWEDLKEHIQKQFQDGMSWENHGLKGWHVDHIIPLSSAKNLHELEKLCHFSNLQPLWAEENIKKSDKKS